MKNLVYAKSINDSQLTGLVEIKKGSVCPEVFCYCSKEVADEILAFKSKSEAWDKLDDEIAAFYDDDLPGSEYDDVEDDSHNLLDIGETAAIAFGYL